jgi:GNAT superfamily N-acetyltransferase
MIVYRKAGVEDIEHLVQLRIDFIKEVQHVENNDNDEALAQEMRRFFISTMPEDGFIAWIAEEDGRIIGTSGLCFYRLAPSYSNMSGGVAYIQNMYTLPEHRGRGIATVLFERLLDEARERGYKKISLHATDMGRPIYEKFGFSGVDNEMELKL